MSRHDAQNTAFADLAAPESPRPRAWSFGASGRVWSYQPGLSVWSSPAVGELDGRAVVAVGSYDHNLYLLDAADGELRWRYATGGPINATPLFWRDPTGATTLFVASTDRLLYALDAETGERRFVHAVESYRPTLGGARLASPALGRVGDAAALFLPHWVWDRSLAHNAQAAALTALSPESGALLWRRELGDNELTAPVVLRRPEGDLIFVGSSNGNLYALAAADGALRWQQTELDAVRAPPAIAWLPDGPRVLMASKFGTLRCLDAVTGAELWRYRTGDWVTASPMVINALGRPLVVVGSYDRSLYALDLLSGAAVWRAFARGGIHASAAWAPLATRPLVVTAAWDHHLHVVEARDGAAVGEIYAGRPLWDAVGLEQNAGASPVVARFGGELVVYHGSYDGRLYAWPLSELHTLAAARERSNLGFWLSFPIALGCVAVVARLWTLHHRRRAAAARR